MRNQDKEIVDLKCRSDWETLIHEWIHDERDRHMLARMLLDGKTISEVAIEFNLSDVYVQQRLAKAKKQLFAHMS